MRHLAEIFAFSDDRLERTCQAKHKVLQLPRKRDRGKSEYFKCRFWCPATNAVFVQANVAFFAPKQCPINVLG